MLIKGKNLTESQRRQVLAAFTYRWTKENRSRSCAWKGIEGKPRIPLTSDEAWLTDHAFHFLVDGSRLMLNRHHAEPHYLAGAD